MNHTYASVAGFGANQQDGAAVADDAATAEAIRKILEASSRRVDMFCGRSRPQFGSGFGPRYGTNRYSGFEIVWDDDMNRSPAWWGTGGRLYFDDDLIALTNNELGIILSPGAGATSYVADVAFMLVPYDRVPARALVPTDTSAMVVPLLRRNISAAGKWGFADDRDDAMAVMGAIANANTKTVTPSALDEFSPGQTLWVGTEMLYVRAVGDTALTVDRGANGSTAAAHAADAAIQIQRYDSRAVDATLQIATRRWRRRDTNQAQAFAASGFVQIAPDPAEEAILWNTIKDLRCLNHRYEIAAVAAA